MRGGGPRANGENEAASRPCIPHWLMLSPEVQTLPRTGVLNLIKTQGLYEHEPLTSN